MLHITYKYINNYKMRGQNKRQQGYLVNAYKLIMYNNNEMTATSFTCNYQFYQSNATDSKRTVYFTALLNRIRLKPLYIQ